MARLENGGIKAAIKEDGEVSRGQEADVHHVRGDGADVQRADDHEADGGSEAANGMNLKTFRKELGLLGKLSWPIVLTHCLLYLIGTVAVIFAGNKGKIELEVVALSTSLLGITTLAFANGFSGCCDTMFAQVYGSKERKKLGVVLQKSLLIMLLGVCPTIALHLNILPLLQLMGHDYQVLRLTDEYLMVHIPGTIAVFFHVVLLKYIQNQNKERPVLVIAFLANIVNVVLHAIFFVWLKTGTWGSAVAQSLSYVSLVLFSTLYIIGSGLYKKTWQGWTSECLLSWWVSCKLGLFSMIQHCIGIWAFEAGVILSGIISLQLLAVQSIVYQLSLIFYTIAWGIGISGGIRVGHSLGANNAKLAKLSSIAVYTTAGTCGIISFVLIFSLRYQLPLIFTQERDLIELSVSIMPIMATCTIFDFIGCTMHGVLRGCGRQNIGSAFSIPCFAFVLFGGITIMFKTSLNIQGFWLSILCAILVQSVIGTIFLCCLNWTNEAKKAQIRVRSGGGYQGRTRNCEIKEGFEEEEKDLRTKAQREKTGENTAVKDKPSTPHVTKMVVYYRLLACCISVGMLLIGIIIRSVMDVQQVFTQYDNSTSLMINATLSYI